MSCCKPGAAATADELREFLAPQFAKWWLPERFEFVDEIPKTSVGKFRKTELRDMFAGAEAAPLHVRAAVINAVDGPFELVDLPDPGRRRRRSLVRVRAAGINFADVLMRRGRYPQMPELPRCSAPRSRASSRTGRASWR